MFIVIWFSVVVGKSGPRGEVGVQEKLWAVETDPLGKITMMSEVSYCDEAVAYKSMRMKLKKKGLRRRVFTPEEVRNPPNLYILKNLILIFIRLTCTRSSTRR